MPECCPKCCWKTGSPPAGTTGYGGVQLVAPHANPAYGRNFHYAHFHGDHVDVEPSVILPDGLRFPFDQISAWNNCLTEAP